MGRILAGIACFLLLVAGTTLMWRGQAHDLATPNAPVARFAAAVDSNAGTRPLTLSPIGQAPSADPLSKEQKRFARADKNEDGRITLAELVDPRRKAFAKLDLNQDGKLGFEEWAIKTIDKYKEADGNHDNALTATEYAATAPKPKAAKPACACG